jgi:hypothetical protein
VIETRKHNVVTLGSAADSFGLMRRLLIPIGVFAILALSLAPGISGSQITLDRSTESLATGFQELNHANSSGEYSLTMGSDNASLNASAPCGTLFSFNVSLWNVTAGTRVVGAVFNASTSFDDLFSGSSSQKSPGTGIVEFAFYTPNVANPAADEIVVTSDYRGTELRTSGNVTVSIRPYVYSMDFTMADKQLDGTVPSGRTFAVIAALLYDSLPVNDVLIVLTSGDGATLNESLVSWFNPNVFEILVVAPAVTSNTTFVIIATASEFGIVLGQATLQVSVIGVPLSVSSIPGYIDSNWPVIVTILLSIVAIVATVILPRFTPGGRVVYALGAVSRSTVRTDDTQTQETAPEFSASTRCIIWNRGSRALDPSAIIPRGGLPIVSPSHRPVEIVDADQPENVVAGFRTRASARNESQLLTFRYWRPMTGVTLESRSTSADPVRFVIYGSVRDGDEVREVFVAGRLVAAAYWILPIVLYAIAVTLIVGCIFPLFTAGTSFAVIPVISIFAGSVPAALASFWLWERHPLTPPALLAKIRGPS